ncbi:MAG: TolC family protein [Panacagrimonas sp.]
MFRLPAFARLAPAALLVLGPVGPVPAAAEDPLSLREALSRTLQSSPDLAAFQFALKAQDGRIAQAGLRPLPSLTGALENVLGTGDTRGFQSAELTIGLSQLIDVAGLRDQRIVSAQLGRSDLETGHHIARLDAVAETARRFVSLVGQQEEHQLTHLAVELAEKTAAVVTRRVEAAKSPEAEHDRAVVALERARIDDEHAEHELLAARVALAASWGAAEPDFTETAADLYLLPPVLPYPELVAALERTPDLERYLSQGRLRDSEVMLAMASRNPGVQVGAALRRLQDEKDTGLVFSVNVPLSFLAGNPGAAAEAEALRWGVEAGRSAALLKARTQLFRYHRELLDTREQVTALRERALPRMEAALRNTEYAYERGRYSYLELVDAQRELLAVRHSLIAAATQYHLTLIEIERITGTALSR